MTPRKEGIPNIQLHKTLKQRNEEKLRHQTVVRTPKKHAHYIMTKGARNFKIKEHLEYQNFQREKYLHMDEALQDAVTPISVLSDSNYTTSRNNCDGNKGGGTMNDHNLLTEITFNKNKDTLSVAK